VNILTSELRCVFQLNKSMTILSSRISKLLHHILNMLPVSINFDFDQLFLNSKNWNTF